LEEARIPSAVSPRRRETRAWGYGPAETPAAARPGTEAAAMGEVEVVAAAVTEVR